jgi:DNA-binding transcriptional LysR family regulator
MNLLHLHYFYTVAKEGGFLRASESLRIQQPAISRMVKQLEENLGFRLFEKDGRNVRLTKTGERVFQHCTRIFSEVEDLRSSLGAIAGEAQGPLAFGANDVISTCLVPSVLEKMRHEHPRIYPIVQTSTAESMFSLIQKRKLAFGLFFHTPELPDNLEMRRLQKLEYKLVVRKDLRKDEHVLQSFIGSREVDDQRNKRFPTLERLRRDHPKAKIKISSNSLIAHKNFVLAGLGVSILPEILVREELRSGKLIALYEKENFQFDIKMVRLKNSVMSLNAKIFFSVFKMVPGPIPGCGA